MYVFCLSCPCATFAFQRGGFLPREWLAAKGLFNFKKVFKRQPDFYDCGYFISFFFAGYDELASAVTTECSASNLTIHLITTLLPNFDHTNFHLNNETCKGNQFNDTHMIFYTRLNECGTFIQTSNDSVTYINFLQGYYKEKSNDSEKIPTKLEVKCKIRQHFPQENVSKSLSIRKASMKPRNSVNASSFPFVTKIHSSGQPTTKPSLKTEIEFSVKPTAKMTSEISVEKEKTSPSPLKPEGKKSAKQEQTPLAQPLAEPLVQSLAQTLAQEKGKILKSRMGDGFEVVSYSYLIKLMQPMHTAWRVVSCTSPLHVFLSWKAMLNEDEKANQSK